MTKHTTTLLKTFLALQSVGFLALPVASQAQTASVPVTANAPKLRFENRLLQGTLGKAYEGALDNQLRVNTVPDTEGTHNKAGLMAKPPGTFIKAGGGYSEPWTRDASLNSWNAASLLSPVEARNTLWAVCERENGKVVLQRDDQWWDKVIWIPAAWNHYKVTGDRQFLQTAYEVAQDELGLMQREHFSTAYGLFQGPAFFCDGIAGYPEPEYDPNNRSSFVLSHPYTKELMTLSTNCVYHGAFQSAAEMAKALGRPAGEAKAFEASAGTLKTAINKHLWNSAKSTYGYFIHGAGPLVGKRDDTQEGIGLAYAILFGVADDKQTQSILKGAHRTAYGLPTQWPHFPRFSDEKPGRHNVIIWPVVNGMWAAAAAESNDLETFQDEVENLVLLAQSSGGRFYEIYNSVTGAVDGGWQVGRQWPSQPEQTWSATAYLRMMYAGLFGMDFQPEGLKFEPKLPAQWGNVSLSNIPYRGAVLNVSLLGQGTKIAKVELDGKVAKQAFIPANLTGSHSIVITMK